MEARSGEGVRSEEGNGVPSEERGYAIYDSGRLLGNGANYHKTFSVYIMRSSTKFRERERGYKVLQGG